MGFTTHIVQSILYTEMILFTFLILPLPRYASKYFILMFYDSKFGTATFHVLLILYAIVFILFIDSVYKLYFTVSDKLFSYHTERNLYLTGFTLYLAVIFRIFTQTLNKLMKEEQSAKILKKQALNQNTFVEDLLKKIEDKDKQILEKENKYNELKKKLLSVKVLLKQYKNNQNEYFALLEKYNNLENKVRKESKKSK